jgi:glycosyltransferase involved in cell wall biosynthesis
MLRLLAAEHTVDAIAFGAPEGQAALAALVERATVVAPPPARSVARRARDLLSADLPDVAQRLWSPTFAATVRRWLAERGYDAVVAEGIELARYLRLVPPERRVYDAHNAEFLLQRRLASTAAPVARAYSRLQWRRLERFEASVVRGSRLTLAVSEHDANQLRALAGPGAQVRVVPNGIVTGAYPFAPRGAEVQPSLLFLGKLDFRPNLEAVRWFLSDVLAGVPEARLFVVGAAPPRWLVRIGQHDDRVAVTGYVADERPYLARCAALVLPFRSGGGSRLKALVAMASGLPIVSTRVGMEGLEAEPGRHYLQADSPSEWLSRLRQVLTDGRVRQQLACAARELVEQRYDWSAIAPALRSAFACLDGA